MTKQRILRAGDILWVLVLTGAAVWFGLTYGITAAFWLDVREVAVADGPVGTDLSMGVDRTIKRDFWGSYSVAVRDFPTATYYCSVSPPPFTYRSTAELPTSLTLNWWLWGNDVAGGTICRADKLPAGRYTIRTCHTVVKPWGLADKRECIDSAPFTVSPPAVAQDYLLQEQRTLERQIDSLQKQLNEVTK